ncbi:hypothetical protein DFJ73DRAFT_862914 [Zopfochytrium polystomum]|nr:hypothetical protein DFJ73DRAFT_862914 [Zopfochytrium polystomum]
MLGLTAAALLVSTMALLAVKAAGVAIASGTLGFYLWAAGPMVQYFLTGAVVTVLYCVQIQLWQRDRLR